MKFAAALIATAIPFAAFSKGYSCSDWSAPGYQEAGPIVAIITDKSLTWTNGTVTAEAKLVHSALGDSVRVFASDDAVYLVSGASTLDVRRVFLSGAQTDSVAVCTPPA